MSRLREKLYGFMVNRNGFDSLAVFLIWLALGFNVISIVLTFISRPAASVCSFLSYFALIYSLFRILSRNKYARSIENRKFQAVKSKLARFLKLQRDRIRDRKTSVYKKCPKCKNILKLPRKKGEHTVKCPCCSEKFDINVLF